MGSPERARWLHLAHSGSQSQRAIWFILPTHGASHIITFIKIVIVVPATNFYEFINARLLFGDFPEAC